MSPSPVTTLTDNIKEGGNNSLRGCKNITMIDKGCESCRKWQEHYYREHMDVSKIRFFKLMTGDFAHRISIPHKLAKNFDRSERLVLKAPSGEKWNVSVDKCSKMVFLKSGWEDFVKAHGLQENDILIFTCSGNSAFDVLIFEASGCAKVSSLFANRNAHNMFKHFDNIVDQGKQAVHCYESDSEDTTPSQPVGSPHNDSISKRFGGRNSRQPMVESPDSSNNHVKSRAIGEEDSDDRDSNYYYSRNANRLSNEEKEKLISLASVRLDNPAFVTILQMSHVRRRSNFLVFPSRFVADHLDTRLHEITLVRPNREDKWCVKYYYAHGAQGIKNYNFAKFVQENMLREGDICAFELMKGMRRVTMTVHAIRKVDGQFVLVG